MSKAILFSFSIFLGSVFASAGKYLSTYSSEKSHSVDEVLQAFPLRCEDPSDCPHAVAKLLYVGPENFDAKSETFQRQVDSCSGFLFGGRYLVTAAHCLLSRESDLPPLRRPRLSDEECALFVRVGFLNGQNRRCAGLRFFAFHPLYEDVVRSFEEVDVAVIELDADVELSSVEIRAEVPSEMEELRLYAFDPPSLETGESVLRAQRCRVSADSLFVPKTSQHDVTIVLRDCEMNPGNSGGVLMNERLEALGVLNSSAQSQSDWSFAVDLPEARALPFRSVGAGLVFAFSLSAIQMEGDGALEWTLSKDAETRKDSFALQVAREEMLRAALSSIGQAKKVSTWILDEALRPQLKQNDDS